MITAKKDENLMKRDGLKDDERETTYVRGGREEEEVEDTSSSLCSWSSATKPVSGDEIERGLISADCEQI